MSLIIVTFTIPSTFPLPVALHRRGKEWYIAYPRAYGMAEGNKYFAKLNDPRPEDTSSLITPTLHHRFWYRSNDITLEALLSAEPAVIKVTGLSRTATLGERTGEESSVLTIEEPQVEVLLQDDQLVQRCSYCGCWEYDDDLIRFVKDLREGQDDLYWCTFCSKTKAIMNPFSAWWQDPRFLDPRRYFQYKMGLNWT